MFTSINLKSLEVIFSVVSGKFSQITNVLPLVSSLCKICDNGVVGINLRCSGQVCTQPPIWTSLNFKDYLQYGAYTLDSVVCISSENKQSNKANIKHTEDVHVCLLSIYYL